MEFGTVIDMEEKVMEEKIEGKKYEQLFMEEVSDMLFAVHSMLSSINVLCSGLLVQDADIRESASAVSVKAVGASSRYLAAAMQIKDKREGINDEQR